MATALQRHNFLTTYIEDHGKFMPRVAMTKYFNENAKSTRRALHPTRLTCAVLKIPKNGSLNEALYTHNQLICKYSIVGQMKRGVYPDSVPIDELLFYDNSNVPFEISDIYLESPKGVPLVDKDHELYNYPKKGSVLWSWDQCDFKWRIDAGHFTAVGSLDGGKKKFGLTGDLVLKMWDYILGRLCQKLNRDIDKNILGFARIDLQLDNHTKKSLFGHRALDLIRGLFRSQEYDVVRENNHPIRAGVIKCRRREIIFWNKEAISNIGMVVDVMTNSREKIMTLPAMQKFLGTAQVVTKNMYKYVGELLHRFEVFINESYTKLSNSSNMNNSLLVDMNIRLGQLRQEVANIETTTSKTLGKELREIVENPLNELGQEVAKLSQQVTTISGDVSQINDYSSIWSENADILVQQGAKSLNQRDIMIGQLDGIEANTESIIRQNNIFNQTLMDMEWQIANLSTEVEDLAEKFGSWRVIDTTTKLGLIQSIYNLTGSYSKTHDFISQSFRKIGKELRIGRRSLDKLVREHKNCKCHEVMNEIDVLSQVANWDRPVATSGLTQVDGLDLVKSIFAGAKSSKNVGSKVANWDKSVATIVDLESTLVVEIIELLDQEGGLTKNGIYRKVSGGKQSVLNMIDYLEDVEVLLNRGSHQQGKSSEIYLTDEVQKWLNEKSREGIVPRGTDEKGGSN